MAETGRKHAPVEQSVHVDCSIEEAFQLFTERFEEWWPLASHSIAEDQAESCVLEPWAGGRLYERTRFGEEHIWGDVLTWNPPERIEFTWHPGRDRALDQTVTVDFSVEADGTRVTLTHAGWQSAGIQASASTGHAAAMLPLDLLDRWFARFVLEMLVAA